jgi:hypothetical protein
VRFDKPEFQHRPRRADNVTQRTSNRIQSADTEPASAGEGATAPQNGREKRPMPVDGKWHALTDTVEKAPRLLGLARYLSICETAFSSFAPCGGTGGFCCGVPRVTEVRRHALRHASHTTKAAGSCGVGRHICFARIFEVLYDGCEMELIARAGEAPQAHALETMMGLQVQQIASRPSCVRRVICRIPESPSERALDRGLPR